MKRNVTYVFGAGASANALPVVKLFNSRLNHFLQNLKFFKSTTNIIADFIPSVQKILKESSQHSTIDTVAKKYFHQNNIDSLKELKKVLTVFFVYEQSIKELYSNFTKNLKDLYLDEKDAELFEKTKKEKIDHRYDSFIASLLKSEQGKFTFPNEVSVITWNYDCQFELAYQKFHDIDFHEAQHLLNVFPKNTGRLAPDDIQKLNGRCFKILHLNGQAHTFYKKDGQIFSLFDKNRRIESNLETAIKYSHSSSITFTWEKHSTSAIQDKEMEEIIKSVRNVLNETEILVIIGYSFPFFNREVDRELFLNNDFEKIYIQDSNATNIKELFSNVFEISGNKIFEYSNIEQFLLPAELDADYDPPPNLAQMAGYFP